MLVYKAGAYAIITLELLPDSKTNENRENIVNHDFAMFRTNKARVVSIVDPVTNMSMNQDSSFYDETFIYTLNKIVEVKDYDDNIEKVKTTGIHYFKTYNAAMNFYCLSHSILTLIIPHEYYSPPKLTRTFYGYSSTGSKYWECYLKNGFIEYENYWDDGFFRIDEEHEEYKYEEAEKRLDKLYSRFAKVK